MGYQVNFNYGLGTGPRITFASRAELSIDKRFEYVSTTTSNFPWLQNYCAFLEYNDELLINIVFEVGKYHS